MTVATLDRPIRLTLRRRTATAVAPLALRTATAADAPAIHALIERHLDEGHLLPRRLEEIAVHAARFVVAADGREILACAELAPLSRSVAEVRSLVVSDSARNLRLGRRLVQELAHRAGAAGFARLCALAHAPGYFVRMGFSIVPHAWLPEKVATDCHACPQFARGCGQHAVVLDLQRAHDTCVPLATIHG
jgi:amino-acid N-acetyltransferase